MTRIVLALSMALVVAAPVTHAMLNGANDCIDLECPCVGAGVPPHSSGVCPLTDAAFTVQAV